MDAESTVQAGRSGLLREARWDAIVIGAGVAGASAALRLMQRAPNSRVLVLERSAWPRSKVCGCCLNRSGMAALAGLGVLDEVRRRGAVEVERLELRCGRRAVTLRAGVGTAVWRSELDDALIGAAVANGCCFVDRASSHIEPEGNGRWAVCVGRGGPENRYRAGAVIVADGVGGSSLRGIAEFEPNVATRGRIGMSAVINDTSLVAPGMIAMHVARHGYVGLVRIGNRVNLGAAVDPAWVRVCGSADAAVRGVLTSCGVMIGEGVIGRISATAMLTRRRMRVSAPGLVVVGDAAGYVEPFTGEGMAWSLASGDAAAEIVAEAVARGLESDRVRSEMAGAWEAWHTRAIRPRHRMCGAVQRIVRWPGLVGGGIGVIGACGAVAALTEQFGTMLGTPIATPGLDWQRHAEGRA